MIRRWAMALILVVWLAAPVMGGSSDLLIESNDLKMPRLHGQWLVFHVGRSGQQVWNLAEGQKVAEIKQYRPLPYDVSGRFVLSVNGAGTWYRFDLDEMDRLTRPMRRIDDLEAIRLGGGGNWFVGVIERYHREARQKQRHLRVFRLNGRPIGGPMTRNLVEERFDVADRLVVWADQTVGRAGVYLASIGDRDPERIAEAIPRAGPWTDGRRVVWVQDGEVVVFDTNDGERSTPLSKVEDSAPLAARLAGGRLVVLNADWAIVLHPIEGGAGRTIVAPEDRAGFKELVGVGSGRVVWRAGEALWSTPLSPAAGGGSDAEGG